MQSLYITVKKYKSTRTKTKYTCTWTKNVYKVQINYINSNRETQFMEKGND